MGHRTRAGRVSEETIAGQAMLRIDIPDGEIVAETEYYGGAAIFSIRPVSEETARALAARMRTILRPAPAAALPAPEDELPWADGEDGDLEH